MNILNSIWYLVGFLFPKLGRVPARRGIPRRGVFFFFFFLLFFQKGDKWSKNVISGPDFLKNEDIWSDFVRFGHIGGLLDN